MRWCSGPGSGSCQDVPGAGLFGDDGPSVLCNLPAFLSWDMHALSPICTGDEPDTGVGGSVWPQCPLHLFLKPFPPLSRRHRPWGSLCCRGKADLDPCDTGKSWVRGQRGSPVPRRKLGRSLKEEAGRWVGGKVVGWGQHDGQGEMEMRQEKASPWPQGRLGGALPPIRVCRSWGEALWVTRQGAHAPGQGLSVAHQKHSQKTRRLIVT